MAENYEDYKTARIAVCSIIETKEKDIELLEKDIANLKKVRRMMDEEFKHRINEKPVFIG